MLTSHIYQWKNNHQNRDLLSDDDIFLRRGLSLNTEINQVHSYKEWDYINSYSLALSAPEKFAQMRKEGIQTLVNGDIGLFSGRILFFSPFIAGMDIGQFEFGVIPACAPLTIKYQGEHSGMHEYILDEYSSLAKYK